MTARCLVAESLVALVHCTNYYKYYYYFVAYISAAAINDLSVTNSQLVTYVLVPTAVSGWPVAYLHIPEINVTSLQP